MQEASVNNDVVKAQNKAASRQSLAWCLETSVSEAAFLFEELVTQLQDPATGFSDLCMQFERIESHLDALRVADESAWPVIGEQLESPTPGLVFVATVLSLEQRNSRRLKGLIALAEADPGMRTAIFHAFAWVPLSFTQPVLPNLLGAASSFYRQIGLQMCRQHAVHADTELERAVTCPDMSLQIMALDAIGENGMLDLLPYCIQRISADNAALCFAACRASLLLGERDRALPGMMQFALKPCPQQKTALALLAASLPLAQAQTFLSSVARQSPDRRLLIQLAGELGDPANIPALLRLMQDDALSRIAAHAFSVITGLDLVAQNMEIAAPKAVSTGPNDNPDDDHVKPDPDEALPWPDQEKVAIWWSQNSGRFTAGQRYLAGQLVSRHQCLAILGQGDQAQRRTAALQLKMMDPGASLFQVEAPSWRQQARLSRLLGLG